MDNPSAVDIVLLPPLEVMEVIAEFTSNFPENPTRPNVIDCLPHISLAMGILMESDLDKASKVLQRLSTRVENIVVNIRRSKSYPINKIKTFSELVVDPNPALLKLHREVFDQFNPILSHDRVGLNNFLSPPAVAEQSIYWVKNYYEHHKTPDEFYPHISLGEGIANKLDTPIRYSGSKLAICHLGTYCTCRKILAGAK